MHARRNLWNLAANRKKQFAVDSVWTKYSMLKAMLKMHKIIDTSKYSKFTLNLKALNTAKPSTFKVKFKIYITILLQKFPFGPILSRNCNRKKNCNVHLLKLTKQARLNCFIFA